MKRLIEAAFGWAAAALQDVGELAAGHVQRDASGLPTGWRLLPLGAFKIAKDGQEFAGALTAEIEATILDQAAAKGTPVPLDLHHNLRALADTLGMEETDLARVLPQGMLTIGFGRLVHREDGLWVDAVEWTDVGRKLVGAGLFRYFSPVIRGLQDGRYRITSVTLTNNPALQGLDAIAASDDGMDGCRGAFSLADLANRAATPPAGKGEQETMKKLLALVGRLAGQDTAALEDASKLPETALAALETLAQELPGLRAAQALGGKVRDCLSLGAEADAATVEGTLRGLVAKAGAHDALKSRVDALELEAETSKRTKIIERGLAEGKLTKAMIDGDWCKGQNAVALEAFLAVAPVVVPPGRAVDTGKLPQGDAVGLTAEDEGIAKALGWTPAQMLEAKKLQTAQQNQG